MNYILNKENEIYYECGWSSDNAIFLSVNGNKYIITDGRYTLDAQEKAKNVLVVESRDLVKKARELILKNRVKKIKIDPNNWNKKEYNLFATAVTLQEVPFYSHKKRVIKSQDELKIIKKAAKLGAKSFDKFAKVIEKNINEYELSYRFKEKLSNRGRRELSFEPIVAINENAAKPHALPSKKKLKKGDLLLLDAGIKYKRYCSDRTRTICINSHLNMSKKQEFSKNIQKVYDVLLKAQEKAIKSVKVGMKARELDKKARDVIENAGYGKYFVHSLGHGVGLDIHEWPYISSRNEIYLEEGMVFTIEPGIYIPDAFGMRIEDMIMIDYNSKPEVLSEY